MESRRTLVRVDFEKIQNRGVLETYQNQGRFVYLYSCAWFCTVVRFFLTENFFVYFLTAHRRRVTKTPQKFIFDTKNEKNGQKGPFLAVFRCFQRFRGYCSKTALTILIKLPGGLALPTAYIWMYVSYLGKFLFFCSFLPKSPKMDQFPPFLTF